MDDLTTERSFDLHAMLVIDVTKAKYLNDVLGLFFYIIHMDVCTTRHWQTSRRLVQELNFCTVHIIDLVHVCAYQLTIVVGLHLAVPAK